MTSRANSAVWQYCNFSAQKCRVKLTSIRHLEQLFVDLAGLARIAIGQIDYSRRPNGEVNVYTYYGQATIGLLYHPRTGAVAIHIMSEKRFRPVVISDFLMERLRPASLQRCGECSWQHRSRERS